MTEKEKELNIIDEPVKSDDKDKEIVEPAEDFSADSKDQHKDEEED